MKKNKFNKIAGALIVVLLICFLILSYIIFNVPLYSKTFDVKFQVGDKIGLTINDSVLNYGIVLPGTVSEKKIELQNNYNFSIKANVFASQGIKDYISALPSFSLMPNEKINYSVVLNVPDLKYGNYSGKIRFDFYRDN